MYIDVKDTNSDAISIKTGYGDNLVYIEGGYSFHHLFKLDELFDFLGCYLGYDLDEKETLHDINSKVTLKKSKKYIDIFDFKDSIKVPKTSLSKYTANKVFIKLADHLKIKICNRET